MWTPAGCGSGSASLLRKVEPNLLALCGSLFRASSAASQFIWQCQRLTERLHKLSVLT